ncbi:MAG: hypothetical protein NE330_17570 [Lentisphaeraceae bacterium]|nr:hypothetical protein [Lentisphaeraceae bacterium]
MIKKYSIPIHKNQKNERAYAQKWFSDCLIRCHSDISIDDYELIIEVTGEGFKRATFTLKE